MTYRLGSLFVLSCVLFAGEKTQPLTAVDASNSYSWEQTITLPSSVDAPVAADTLVSAFHDPSSLTRVNLLEELDSSPAVDRSTAVSLLRDSLYDQDQLVREAALHALINRDNVDNPVLSSADVAPFQGETAELAQVHLAAQTPDAASLRALLQTGDAVVQENAFNALANNDLPGAAALLRAEFRDKTSLHRLQTLELFSRSAYTNSPGELMPILREAANDQDPLVRNYATRTLTEMKSQGESSPAQ